MLERVENLTDEVMEERKKKFGKISGTWICVNCKHKIDSYLFNFEYHVPEICPQCKTEKMIEDESLREKPFRLLMGGGKQAEDQWLAKQPIKKQAEILLGDDPDY